MIFYQFVVVLGDPNRGTGFRTGHHADEAFFDLISFHDLAGQVFFGDRGRLEMLHRPPCLLRQGFDMILQLLTELLRKETEVFILDVVIVEKLLDAILETKLTQSAPKRQPNISRQHTLDLIAMLFQKTHHDFHLSGDARNNIMTQESGAFVFLLPHFGCGEAALGTPAHANANSMQVPLFLILLTGT